MSSLEGEARMGAAAQVKPTSSAASARRHAHRFGRADRDGRRDGAARRCVSAGQGTAATVILGYGPYAKGLAFQDGYPSAWQRMAESIPTSRRARAVSTRAGSRRSGEMGADGVCLRARRFPWRRLLAGRDRSFSPRETKDSTSRIDGPACTAWFDGKVGLNRHFLLRHRSMARARRSSRRVSPPCASGKAPPTGIAT